MNWSPTSIGSHNGQAMTTVEDAMSRLATRAKGYTSFGVDRVSELQIHWSDQDSNHRDSGYYAKIDGRDMKLSRQAFRGASKLIGQPNVKHWGKYPDRNAFPTALAHILDNASTDGKRQNAKHLLVRHDGLQIRAILPNTYKIFDAAEMLDTYVGIIKENVGQVQGVSMIEDGDPGDITSLRVIVGQNIIPTLKPEFGQYMMFLIATSETGAMESHTAMGCYRTCCTNSAIRHQLTTKWTHKRGLDDWIGKSAERLKQMGYYQDQYARVFTALHQTKLTEVQPREMLHGMFAEKLITSGHYDAAQLYIDSPTEDGRPVETQYDLFNVLTRSAQDLDSLEQRQKAESRALHLFTEPGGVFERLRNAAVERAREAALNRGNAGGFDAED